MSEPATAGVIPVELQLELGERKLAVCKDLLADANEKIISIAAERNFFHEKLKQAEETYKSLREGAGDIQKSAEQNIDGGEVVPAE